MRAERLVSIILLLQVKGRMTAGELAEELGVAERTIYRDLEALSMSGVALYGDRGPGGGYALVDGYRTSLTGLSEAEASSLFVASLPRPLADLGLDKTLRDAMLKLLASLPAGKREQVEQERSIIHLDAAPWFQSSEAVPWLTLFQQAARMRQRIKMRYQYPDGRENDRIIEPYGLVAKSTLWYLVAETPNGMRCYRVSRILEAFLLEERFERPADFELADYWEAARDTFIASLPLYPVTVRASAQMCELLADDDRLRERIAASPQDESGWRTFVLNYETFNAAKSELMRLGGDIEVLEPAELRESIIATTMQLLARYGMPAALPEE